MAVKAAGPDGDITTTEDNVNHRIAIVGYASRYDSTILGLIQNCLLVQHSITIMLMLAIIMVVHFRIWTPCKDKIMLQHHNVLDGNGATYT